MTALGPHCPGCPAYHQGRGFVPPTGPLDAPVVFIGEGAGSDEADTGEPFVGRAGSKLTRWMERARPPLLRHRCLITNTIWCQLPKNRDPRRAELDYCTRHYLVPLLQKAHQARPLWERILHPVGSVAASWLYGRKAGEMWAGAPTKVTSRLHDLGVL